TKTVGMLDLEDLPRNARAYLDRVAETCDVALGMISTGPRREETLLIDNAEMRRLIPDLETVIAGRGTP
ncbi:MAG: adenylosuccinate synthetase, partial [Acidobacteriota bacterium]